MSKNLKCIFDIKEGNGIIMLVVKNQLWHPHKESKQRQHDLYPSTEQVAILNQVYLFEKVLHARRPPVLLRTGCPRVSHAALSKNIQNNQLLISNHSFINRKLIKDLLFLNNQEIIQKLFTFIIIYLP